MTDTRFQLHDRIDSLTGELKAAEEQDRLNADDLAAKEYASSLARQAKEKSEANITRIKSAIREAGQAYSEAVLALTGAESAPVADEAAPTVEIEYIDPPATLVSPAYDGVLCRNHGRAIYTTHEGATVCDECGQAYEPSFPNAIFNGIDRAFDEATQP